MIVIRLFYCVYFPLSFMEVASTVSINFSRKSRFIPLVSKITGFPPSGVMETTCLFDRKKMIIVMKFRIS